MDVGLRDAALSGWYRQESGELFEGFPINSDDIVADIGCGHGGNASFCGARCAEIIITDIDPATVAAAEQRLKNSCSCKVTAIVSDSYPLSIEGGVVSKIVSTDVIEHVDDPMLFLRELVRIGRPGAAYFLTAPDAVHERLQKPLALPAYFERPNHVRIVDRDEFSRLVTDSGLVVERQGHFGFYWALWFTLFWACDVDLSSPRHPALDHWSQTWQALLGTDKGPAIKRALDNLLPKTQYIIARKP